MGESTISTLGPALKRASFIADFGFEEKQTCQLIHNVQMVWCGL